LAKDDEEDKETGKGGDEVRESEGESEGESEEEEGSFDPIPRTPEDSEKESNDEEEQESRLSEEARIQKEEDADELYHSVNATLEAEVLTRSSHSSRTSYAIAVDLSEMELKKILIEKMEGNKS
nr:hypothetical protein [Tanacetum cinerariifolium]